jgi:hypothetical protein
VKRKSDFWFYKGEVEDDEPSDPVALSDTSLVTVTASLDILKQSTIHFCLIEANTKKAGILDNKEERKSEVSDDEGSGSEESKGESC